MREKSLGPDWNRARWYCTCGRVSWTAEEHTVHQRNLVTCGIRVVTRVRTPEELESLYQSTKRVELFIHGLQASDERRQRRIERSD